MPTTWSLQRFDALADEVTQLLFLRSSSQASPGSGSDAPPRLLSRPQLPKVDRKGFPQPLQAGGSALSSGAVDAAAAAVAAARQQALRKLAAAQADAVASSRSDVAPSGRGGSAGGNSGDDGSSFPFGLVSAINSVLYDRHGYTRMPRHGDPRY